MPLISVPVVVRDKYISMCKAHNKEKDVKEKIRMKLRAYGYKEAISDLCGGLVLGSILIDADLELPDDGRPACGGMYLD